MRENSATLTLIGSLFCRYAELPRVVRVAQMSEEPGDRKKVCVQVNAPSQYTTNTNAV